ncbi:transcriptional regulator [Candidatus Nitrosotenuis cloacae]|uniref:transcriptional regulator n=1 Tax=Candidatus Nitrosotenuis cloacae TaxID=1603555 RepID=UPI00228288D0|nr:transcriptional regulator [Candidatus Nitrosotenuis cloacae]
MEEEPKDIIVLGAIKKGAKKFDKIKNQTGIDAEELNKILEKLEERGFIKVEKKKSLFGGEKTELHVTEKGANEVDQRVHEMQQKWNQMMQMYKLGDKKKLEEFMGNNKMDFPMMMFFGIMNMMMFSMMFSMIGASMGSYVPQDQIPPGAENQPADGGDAGGDAGMDGGGDGGGGFDIDIGF